MYSKNNNKIMQVIKKNIENALQIEKECLFPQEKKQYIKIFTM